MDFTFGRILSFARANVPVAKDTSSFARQGVRDQETPLKTYLRRVGRDDFDSVLATKVERGFTAHQFLAGADEVAFPVLLGMRCSSHKSH